MGALPYRLSLATDFALVDAARALEAHSRPDADSFDRYESSSVFLVATDGCGDVCAAARLILPGPAGSRTIAEIARRSPRAAGQLGSRVDLARTWDVASVSVHASSARIVAPALCYGVVQALRVNRARFVVATLDEASRPLLAGVGLLPQPVLGASVWGRVSELLDVQRQVNLTGWRLVTQGVGLHEVVLPKPEQLRVTAARRVTLAGAAVRELAATG